MLTDMARRMQKDGVIVGCLLADEDDAPSLLCIAAAFEHAGLEVSVRQQFDAWSSSPVARQLGILGLAVEQHAAPCLLVVDEVDRLPPESIRVLDRLLQ